jgi:predicted nucleic acid-binding protein
MPAALLDTNAVSDLMRDHPQVKARIATHADPIATSVVVVGEIGYGLGRLPPGKKRTDLEARAQKILAALRIEPVTEQIAKAYGRLKASLESQGLNLDDNDLWIAATVITQGDLVVTRDQIFSRVPGLQVEDWSV